MFLIPQLQRRNRHQNYSYITPNDQKSIGLEKFEVDLVAWLGEFLTNGQSASYLKEKQALSFDYYH